MRSDPRALAKAVAELAATLTPNQVSDLAAATADLLMKHKRRDVALFPKLLRRMLRRYGPVEADMEAALIPAAAEQKTLETALGKTLGRPVTLTVRENTSLIGGARLRVGDERLDASLRGALERLPSLLRP